jgi:uncharacterized membrane protein YfcA
MGGGLSVFLFFAILLISLVLTMIGLGGGLIFSPLFVLLDFPKSVAVSSSLFINGVAGASAALVYFRKGMMDFPVAVPLIIGSSLAAPVGAVLTYRLPPQHFLFIMACVLSLAAIRMFSPSAAEKETAVLTRQRRIVGGCLIGIAIGFLAGILGTGGGVFVVPSLIYLLGVQTRTAAATSTFVVFFSSFTGFMTHMSIVNIDWSFLLPAGFFSFVGGQIGSRIMATRLKGRTIRIMFGVILCLMAVKLLHRAWS